MAQRVGLDRDLDRRQNAHLRKADEAGHLKDARRNALPGQRGGAVLRHAPGVFGAREPGGDVRGYVFDMGTYTIGRYVFKNAC